MILCSCDEVTNLTFSEQNNIYNDQAKVEINIPVAEGSQEVAKAINTKLENHIANMLVFSEDDSPNLKLDEALTTFESEYLKFKEDFNETALVFEASFDGEVIYHSSELICIALTGYTNTGGAHGNSNITLYNFDPQTGKTLELNEIINDKETFTSIVEIYFKDEIANNTNRTFEDYFFDNKFHLPANIGFNEEGVLVLYNPYEVAAYAMGITEFTIPFEKVDNYLKVH